MRKNPTYTALLGPTRLLISEKSATYTIKWSYTIIWQVRVLRPLLSVRIIDSQGKFMMCLFTTHSMWTKDTQFFRLATMRRTLRLPP